MNTPIMIEKSAAGFSLGMIYMSFIQKNHVFINKFMKDYSTDSVWMIY